MGVSNVIRFIIVPIMILTFFACGEPPTYSDADLRSILNLTESNKVSAESQYKGKYIRIRGEVREIGKGDIDLIPVGSDMFQMSGANCDLAGSEKSKIVNLRKGQRVTVKGKVSGISSNFLNIVKIKKCLLE